MVLSKWFSFTSFKNSKTNRFIPPVMHEKWKYFQKAMFNIKCGEKYLSIGGLMF